VTNCGTPSKSSTISQRPTSGSTSDTPISASAVQVARFRPACTSANSSSDSNALSPKR
jgi:hypothetical protein